MLRPAGVVVLQLPYDDRHYATVEQHVAPTSRIGSGYYHGHAREYGLDILDRLRVFWPVVHEIQPLLIIDAKTAVRYGFEKNFGTLLICSNVEFAPPLPGTLERNLTGLKRHWLTQLAAYHIWLQRAAQHENPLENWLEAERIVAAMTPEEVLRWNVYNHLAPPHPAAGRDSLGREKPHVRV